MIREDLAAYRKIICRNPLFSGMGEEAADRAVSLLNGETVSYQKGDILHQPWTRLDRFGLVLTGVVQACCDDFDGNSMIMAEVLPGTTFGESLCFLQIQDSPVYVFASEDAKILWLSVKNLYGGSTEELVQALQKRFTSLLAARALTMNSRIQILSKISIRDKLMVYFSQLVADRGGEAVFRVPLSREDMATYIGANRSALSRELSRMKREGLIDYHKNTFRLLRRMDDDRV